jgi:KDO2-lipid IV(A) lauroyltransferase
MAGYSLSLLGFPVHALYRPLDLKPADEWVREQRGRRGLVLVDKFGAARLMPQILSSGMPLGFVADQNAGDRGIYVPFFNRMASTYKAIGLSATRYNATIIVGMARRSGGQALSTRAAGDGRSIVTLAREPDGLRYDLSMVDIFGPEDYFAQPDPLFYIAARYRRAIEQSVREAPEQFLWMHRYWKSRPRWERQGRAVPEPIVRKLRELPWMTETDVDAIRAHAERDTLAYAQSRPAGAAPERETPESDDDF